MAIYLYRLGRLAARRAWAVILTWLLLLAIAGGAAFTLQKPFTKQLSIPGTEFQQVLNDLEASLPEAAGGTSGVVFKLSVISTMPWSLRKLRLISVIISVRAYRLFW